MTTPAPDREALAQAGAEIIDPEAFEYIIHDGNHPMCVRQREAVAKASRIIALARSSGGGEAALPRSPKDETWPAVPHPRLDDEVQIVLRGKVSKTFAGDGFNIVDPFGHNISFTKADLRNAILTSPTDTAALPPPAPSGMPAACDTPEHHMLKAMTGGPIEFVTVDTSATMDDPDPCPACGALPCDWSSTPGVGEPIKMILHCPSCALQHIDQPNDSDPWTNPPHRSHLCRGCGTIWRPTDVPTEGVAAIKTKGKADHIAPAPAVDIAVKALEEITDPAFAKNWQEAYMTFVPKGVAVTRMQQIAASALKAIAAVPRDE